MTHRLLITGATGFVGSALMQELREEGHELICPTRTPLPFSAPNLRNPTIQNLDEHTDWTRCFHSPIDVVIHCAARVHVMHETTQDPLGAFRAANVAATLALARAAVAAGARQFIFLSSVKVNGEVTACAQAYTEEQAAQPVDAYGISKYEAENALLALGATSGMAITIIRPPLVYGPGVKANFAHMLRWIKQGLPLPLASLNNRRSLVYLGNLTHFIRHCILHPKAAQQVFFVADRVDVSTATLLRACAQALQVPARLLPCPPQILLNVAKFLGRKSVAERLCLSLQIDTTKAQQQLAWRAPYTLEQGLAVTVKSYL